MTEKPKYKILKKEMRGDKCTVSFETEFGILCLDCGWEIFSKSLEELDKILGKIVVAKIEKRRKKVG